MSGIKIHHLFIHVPWLVCPADNLIDWNTKEENEKSLNSLKEWNKQMTKSNIQKMIDYHPRTNSPTSWM